MIDDRPYGAARAAADGVSRADPAAARECCKTIALAASYEGLSLRAGFFVAQRYDGKANFNSDFGVEADRKDNKMLMGVGEELCLLSTQSGRDSKGSRRVYWYYIATPAEKHRKNNGLMWRHKDVERARSFKSINESAV